MLGMLKRRGYRFTPEPARADIVIINTCGFIEDAKKEAIEQIFDAVRLKEEGLVRGVIRDRLPLPALPGRNRRRNPGGRRFFGHDERNTYCGRG